MTVVVSREGVKANPDFYSVEVGSSENVLTVVANDAAIPDRGRRLAVVSVGTGLNAPNRGGSVRISEAGDALVYTPATGFAGEETFTYTVTDSRSTDTAKVVVRVASGALSANDDAYTVFFAANSLGETVSFTLPVVSNDRISPSAGEVLRVTGVGIDDSVNEPNAPDQDGLVSISPDGAALIYTPTRNSGVDYLEHFTYEITDGTARRAQGRVQVQVLFRDGDRDLETNDDAFSVERDSSQNVLPVLANDEIKPASAQGWTITGVSAASSRAPSTPCSTTWPTGGSRRTRRWSGPLCRTPPGAREEPLPRRRPWRRWPPPAIRRSAAACGGSATPMPRSRKGSRRRTSAARET